MTAESIAFPSYPPGQGPLYGAELEAWYEDLQDILYSDTFKCSPLPECTQKEPEFLDVLETCSLSWLSGGGEDAGTEVADFSVEAPKQQSVLGDLFLPEFYELLGADGEDHQQQEPEPESSFTVSSSEEEAWTAESAPSSPFKPSHHPSPGNELMSSVPSQGTKRKKSGSPARNEESSCKKSRKYKDLENEKKVTELREQNERLKKEIDRLSEEVQRTRRALIDKLVNVKKS
ncbi:DNA damage-inducible transcript 3 protein-like [Acipenser ruthenus]|uniref:DNA damage-inducible transcript 3 protein-like n=1 Tax=Acipenser ruthenus TaxID=7906 RepID=UPI002742219F|nr:DNA damage-inducible transcript 3 protein-like [Acipenser ruthenus]